MAKYYQTFTVETNFLFPIDMLRYDSCFPATEKDAGEIHKNLTANGSPLKVKVARYIDNKATKPTTARWDSFGCRISKIETRK